MHPQRRLFGALLALLLTLLPLQGLAEAENLILNPEVDGLDGWVADAWDSSAELTTHALADEGYDDGTSLYVENRSANDARYVQSIWVEPNTIYRISCYVKAEGCGEEATGATLSIQNTFVYSDSVYDTNGQWQYLEMYGETGPDQTELTLMARIGGYGSTNVGRAWFDHFEMVAVDEVPTGALLLDFSTPAPVSDSGWDDDVDEEPERNTEALILIACLFVALACAGWSTVRRLNEGDLTKRGRGETPIFCCLLLVALVVRLYLAARYPGYRVDINCFEAWSARLAKLGPYAFYDPENYFCDYPPVYLMLLTVMEWVRRLFGIAADGTLHHVLIKFWPIVCDLLGAALIYRVGRKHIGATSAAALGTLHAFNIAGLAISAAWGQADSVLTLLIALTLLLAIDRKWTPALILYALAVLTKPQALLFAPVGVAFFLRDVIQDRQHRLRTLLSALIGLAVAYVVLLPFSLRLYGGVLAPVKFLIALFTGTTGGYSYMTVNALNLYCAFNLNWVSTALHPVLTGVAWALLFAGFLYGCALVFVSRNRRDVLLISAAVISLIFAFGPMMHERYLYPCILLLALYYALGRDRRALFSLILCSATLFLNTTLVLQGGMGAGNYGHLQSSEQLLNAIVSLVNVFNALFLGYVSFRACVQRKGSEFRDHPPVNEPPEAQRLLEHRDARLRLTRRDWLLMGAVTAIYAVVAFVNLGDTVAPQTEWTSTAADEQIVFDLGETRPFRMTYYGGICNTHFTVALSDDGEHWSEDFAAEYNQGDIFRWFYYVPKTNDGGSFSNAYGSDASDPDAPVTYFAGDALPTDALNAFFKASTYPPQQARYVRITAVAAGLKLREIGFLDSEGNPQPATIVSHTSDFEGLDDAAKLIDEPDAVPAVPSYLNSTYFDEIYHARTGYEFQQGTYNTYEWTHPPLGKVLIMVGINLFGMTPFGWRFMGALIGVLMVPLMYLMAKQLTHRTDLSFVAMALMALDSMHFTQTRIATVDSYAVFFIMLMYLFMFRYQQMNWNHEGLWRTLVPLGLCGLSMALGIASKWIGIYAAIGLAVIFFCTLWKRFSEHRYAVRNDGAGAMTLGADQLRWIWLLAGFVAGVLALLLCAVRLVLPMAGKSFGTLTGPVGTAAIAFLFALMLAGFALCAYATLRCRDSVTTPRTAMERARCLFWRNTTLTILFCVLFFIVVPVIVYYLSYYWQLQYEGGLNVKRVVQLQQSMYNYHAGLGGDTHYFRSPWYQWPIIWWPMWYYSGTGYMPDGVISSISCMGNPAVWWTGLVALLATFWFLATKKRKPDSYHLVIIGFLSQFLPWVLVPRSTFIYHYFASVPFIILCTALMLDRIRIRNRKRFVTCAAVLLVAALVLFIAFYPLESGLPVARWYANLLRWFKWYNF